MKIPKNIHFCGFDYKVALTDRLDGGDSWGRTDTHALTIDIEKNMPAQKQEQTFIHELLHVAFRHTQGWEKIATEDEEKLIKAWAMNIYGILKDNKLLK